MMKLMNQNFEYSMLRMGLRHPIPMRALLSLRWLLMIGALAMLILALAVFDGLVQAVCLLAAVMLALLTDLWVAHKARLRCRQLDTELPDAIDLLTLAMDAGLSLDASLHRVAMDIGASSKLLGDEFLALSLALRSGLPRAQALADMAWRCDSSALDMLASLVAQADRLGTPVIDAAKALAHSMRQKREYQAQERAGKVAVQLVVPLILCLLPALFVVLLGPALLQVSDVLREL